MILPHNFGYLGLSRIAGSGHPGFGTRLAETLAALREEGIEAILTVFEEPLDAPVLQEFGMKALHLPVPDFSPPTPEQIDRAMEFVETHARPDSGVLVHCYAGYGRTGTILACYLVARGMSAEAAIDEVRRIRPGSIEDPSQEDAIHAYERRRRGLAPREGAAGEE